MGDDIIQRRKTRLPKSGWRTAYLRESRKRATNFFYLLNRPRKNLYFFFFFVLSSYLFRFVLSDFIFTCLFLCDIFIAKNSYLYSDEYLFFFSFFLKRRLAKEFSINR